MDFAVLGLILGRISEFMHSIGIYGLAAVLLIVLILPSILKPSDKSINHVVEE
ncbi:MAG: hypothetical protein Q4B23_01225 [Helcococcus sp.]|nr:hypothetical protein [Helcococcus sp.]